MAYDWEIPSFESEPPEDAAADGPPPPLIEPSERAASSFASDLRASLAALWESKRYGDVRLQARGGDEVLVHRLEVETSTLRDECTRSRARAGTLSLSMYSLETYFS